MTPTTNPDQPQVLRCHGTADFLAALPFLTGFTAKSSLFVVSFRGSRSSGAMRIDLPESSAPGPLRSYLDGIAGLLHDTGAGPSCPALVIACEETFAAAGTVPWKRLAKALARRIEREGWQLRDLAVVAPDGWAEIFGPRAGERRKLSEIRGSSISAAAAAFAPPPPPLDSLGTLPEADPVRNDAVANCLAALTEHPGTTRMQWAAELANSCFSTDPASQPNPAALAELILAAAHPSSWFVLALAAIVQAEHVSGLAEAWNETALLDLTVHLDEPSRAIPPRPWSLQSILDTVSLEQPEPRRLRHAITVLADAATHTPEARRPALLALLAWTWWMLGMQSVSQRLVAAALRIDEAHPLALIIGHLNQTPPRWEVRDLKAALTDPEAA